MTAWARSILISRPSKSSKPIGESLRNFLSRDPTAALPGSARLFQDLPMLTPPPPRTADPVATRPVMGFSTSSSTTAAPRATSRNDVIVTSQSFAFADLRTGGS